MKSALSTKIPHLFGPFNYDLGSKCFTLTRDELILLVIILNCSDILDTSHTGSSILFLLTQLSEQLCKHFLSLQLYCCNHFAVRNLHCTHWKYKPAIECDVVACGTSISLITLLVRNSGILVDDTNTNLHFLIDFDINSIIFHFGSAPVCIAMTFPRLNTAKRGNPWILYLSTVFSCTSVSTITNLISESGNSSDTLKNMGATADTPEISREWDLVDYHVCMV